MTDVSMRQDGFTTNQSQVRSDKKRRKGRRIPVSFASDVHGMNIRNAATGSYYDERVGTVDEKRFFKVSGRSMFKINDDGVVVDEGYNMSSFYYDTPEQYEQHKNVVLSQDVKDKWYSRGSFVETRAIDETLNENSDEDDIDEMMSRLKNI